MDMALQKGLRDQLVDRDRRLRATLADVGEAPDLVRLLQEVDAALTRFDSGAFGLCRFCGEAIEHDFLKAHPAIEYCLCHLSSEQQAFLQKDLDLAAGIQRSLLPPQDLLSSALLTHYRYIPAGPVSGDYCDIIPHPEGGAGLYFLLGDVSGKGVASSLVMAHLNALIRGLVAASPPVSDLVARTNRLLTASGFASHYATLVCGRTCEDGRMEICNAGHCPPLILHGDGVEEVAAAGLPVGMFEEGPYPVETVSLAAGETLVLYTDGLTEASNGDGEEYGVERLTGVLQAGRGLAPRALAAACLKDLERFTAGTPRPDDLTLLLLRREDSAAQGGQPWK